MQNVSTVGELIRKFQSFNDDTQVYAETDEDGFSIYLIVPVDGEYQTVAILHDLSAAPFPPLEA